MDERTVVQAKGRTDGYGTPVYAAPEQLAGGAVDVERVVRRVAAAS